jgi:hypothetical protein
MVKKACGGGTIMALNFRHQIDRTIKDIGITYK